MTSKSQTWPAGLCFPPWPRWPWRPISQSWLYWRAFSRKLVSRFVSDPSSSQPVLWSFCSTGCQSGTSACLITAPDGIPHRRQVRGVTAESLGETSAVVSECSQKVLSREQNGSGRKKSLFPMQQTCSVGTLGLMSVSPLTHSLDQPFFDFSGHKTHPRKPC